MLKKILIILIISISLTCYGKTIDRSYLQNRYGTFYEINQKNPYTGEATFYYENGKLELQENYKDGKLDGDVTYFYKDGKIKFKEHFKNGERNGESITYYKNGEIKSKIKYKNGKEVD